MIIEQLKLPLRFSNFFEKKKLARCGVSESISRNIHLLITTQKGENMQDYEYGCQFWDHDYDIHMNNAMRKELISNDLKYLINKYEKRIFKTGVEVNVIQREYNMGQNLQLRRRVEVEIRGLLVRNNEQYHFKTGFFIGPMLFD